MHLEFYCPMNVITGLRWEECIFLTGEKGLQKALPTLVLYTRVMRERAFRSDQKSMSHPHLPYPHRRGARGRLLRAPWPCERNRPRDPAQLPGWAPSLKVCTKTTAPLCKSGHPNTDLLQWKQRIIQKLSVIVQSIAITRFCFLLSKLGWNRYWQKYNIT